MLRMMHNGERFEKKAGIFAVLRAIIVCDACLWL